MSAGPDQETGELHELDPVPAGEMTTTAVPLNVLTPRQGVAAALKAVGRSDEQIAEELGVDRSTVYRWRSLNPTFRLRVAEIQQDLSSSFAAGLRRLAYSSLEVLGKQVEEEKDAKVALAIVQLLGPTLMKEALTMRPATRMSVLLDLAREHDNEARIGELLPAEKRQRLVLESFQRATQPTLEERRGRLLRIAAESPSAVWPVAEDDEATTDAALDVVRLLAVRSESLVLATQWFGEWDEESDPESTQGATEELDAAKMLLYPGEDHSWSNPSLEELALAVERIACAVGMLTEAVALISPASDAERIREVGVMVGRFTGEDVIRPDDLPSAIEALDAALRSLAWILAGDIEGGEPAIDPSS
jgi:hypothetical protein